MATAYSIKGIGLPLTAWLCFAASTMGLFTTAIAANDASSSGHSELFKKVMVGLPRYGAIPTIVADQKPIAAESTEIVHLVPFVVVGAKVPKFRESDLLTTKAFASVILKRYNYSAFSMFRYREDMRLREMATLQHYSDALKIMGDFTGSREMKEMSDRLFFRSGDLESARIDNLLNSRYR